MPAYVANDKDRAIVEAMAAVGVPYEMICSVLQDGKGIDSDTMRKYYPQELRRAKANTCFNVAKSLYQKAMSGDTACMIFWAKSQMGFREVQHVELTGKDGRPLGKSLADAVSAIEDDLVPSKGVGGDSKFH